MKVNVEKKALAEAKSDTLAVFVTKSAASAKSTKKKAKSGSEKSISGASKDLKTLVMGEDSISGDLGEAILFRNANVDGFKNILAIGTGSNKDLETLRQAGAHFAKALKSNKLQNATLSIDTAPKASTKGDAISGAICEGIFLASYEFADHKKKTDKKEISISLATATKSKQAAMKKGLEYAETLAGAVNFSRNLGDQPGNKLTPVILAKRTADAAKGSKLKVTAWDEAAMKKKGMGSLLGVSAGSDAPARLIIMEYKGAAASKKPICLVGKGLTFDSGGISLKPGAGMEEMKYDMCGGANVIGAMVAIARLKLKVNAIGIVPASENMPGPSANKPGDICTAMNGMTIEVNNTDAEGRLILADALCYANTRKPAVICDAATLTGAMMIALGNSHTGVYCQNDRFMGKIKAAADRAGERVWHMPLCEDHEKDMKGTYADLTNLSPSRNAGSATAAAFLKNFVDPEIPWAHFDIAGTAWHTGNRFPYNPAKGASGAMVRTFVELAKNY